MKYVVTIFWICIAFIVVLFTTLNSYSVSINYSLGKLQVYFPLLLVIFLFIGSLFGMCALLPVVFKLKRRHIKLKGDLKNAHKELDSLRTMPVTDSVAVET